MCEVWHLIHLNNGPGPHTHNTFFNIVGPVGWGESFLCEREREREEEGSSLWEALNRKL